MNIERIKTAAVCTSNMGFYFLQHLKFYKFLNTNFSNHKFLRHKFSDDLSKMLNRICRGQLTTVNLRSSNFLEVISTAISMGAQLLIENVAEPIPLILKQLIEPNFIKKDNLLVINYKFYCN